MNGGSWWDWLRYAELLELDLLTFIVSWWTLSGTDLQGIVSGLGSSYGWNARSSVS